MLHVSFSEVEFHDICKLFDEGSHTLAPMRVFMVFAVAATIPPTIATAPATRRNQRLPNLSDRRPVRRRLIALQSVHMIENRLELSLGPEIVVLASLHTCDADRM
jgi:hypothetical protein